MLKIQNLYKAFNNNLVIDDLSLTLDNGEIYGFLGPNGAGKSTTVKIIVDIYKTDQGKITIDKYINTSMEAKKLIGYIPDEPYVYERLNAKEFLSFIADIYKLENKSKRIDQALELFDIDEDKDLNIENFSRGSKQKLIIAGTLMHEPKLLIIDEPLVGLDVNAIIKFQVIINNFVKNGGTVFISTHSLDIVSKLCTRIGIINHGKLIIEDTIENLYKKEQDNNLENIFLKLTDEK